MKTCMFLSIILVSYSRTLIHESMLVFMYLLYLVPPSSGKCYLCVV